MSENALPQPDYLKSLNTAQYDAVTHDPSIPLQILAGPGSGKTRVLTSRVAHLVKHHQIAPESICAVTFTNKAANEMRHRLKPLIGEKDTAALVMGTFHAICSKYLRRHGHKIDLPNNFSICDADEATKIIKNLFKAKEKQVKAEGIELSDRDVVSAISLNKNRGMSYAKVLSEALSNNNVAGQIIADIYEEYEDTLNRQHALDFDDLLVYGVKLFKKCPAILDTCRHILVDEFQDTSILQYDLVKLFAAHHNGITIVGDPDQSIYGWRAAEIENLDKMGKDFKETRQIFLEENYRSTAAILAASHWIMAQDTTRIDKGLFTSHAAGPLPALHCKPNEHAEADFVGDEIKRLIAFSGGMLNWNDFAILLRYNALSRPIEAAFQKQGIPMRMLAGQKFFDRAEVKDVLAYLQLVDNPRYDPAFHRIINVPLRALGEKSIAEIKTLAKSKELSCYEVCQKIARCELSGSDPRLTTKLQKELPSFINVIERLRKSASNGKSVVELIRQMLDATSYEKHIHRTYPDGLTRWENVQELLTFAEELCPSPPEEKQSPTPAPGEDGNAIVLDDDGNVIEADVAPDLGETPLRLFLQASSLSTDTETSEGEDSNNKPRVTISTCHAAKGLEWPVVFVPAVEDGTFPFYRTESVDEERRLLYVACTRAQGILYLSHTEQRMAGGKTKDMEMSQFIKAMEKTPIPHFGLEHLPDLSAPDLAILGKVLRRDVPDESKIAAKRQAYRPPIREVAVPEIPFGGGRSKFMAPPSQSQRAPPPPVYNGPPPTFSTAGDVHRKMSNPVRAAILAAISASQEEASQSSQSSSSSTSAPTAMVSPALTQPAPVNTLTGYFQATQTKAVTTATSQPRKAPTMTSGGIMIGLPSAKKKAANTAVTSTTTTIKSTVTMNTTGLTPSIAPPAPQAMTIGLPTRKPPRVTSGGIMIGLPLSKGKTATGPPPVPRQPLQGTKENLSSGPPGLQSLVPPPPIQLGTMIPPAVVPAGNKRRLGMGRGAQGYTSQPAKKAKRS